MNVRSQFGLDGFDLTVHLLITFFAIIVLGPVMQLNPGVALGIVPIASLLILAWRRKRGLATLPPESTAEVEAARLFDLEHRVAELEMAQERMLELEERVDFAERLLAQRAESEPKAIK